MSYRVHKLFIFFSQWRKSRKSGHVTLTCEAVTHYLDM